MLDPMVEMLTTSSGVRVLGDCAATGSDPHDPHTRTAKERERAKERAEQENISCETIVHVGGQFHEYIVQEAKKREADLIVMGTQGRTGLKKLIIGSVAQRVLAHAPCPVLVTPA